MTPISQWKQEYETRIKALERSLASEQDRRRHYGFLNKQLEAQVKKLQTENVSLTKELKASKKCASCTCLEERRKQADAFGWLMQGIKPGDRGGIYASTGTIPPVDPEQPKQEAQIRELQVLRSANFSLQRCVENLQSMLKEKAKEAVQMEEQYKGAVGREQERNRFLNEDRAQLLDQIRYLKGQLDSLCDGRRNHTMGSRSTPSGSTGDQVQSQSSISRYCKSCNERIADWEKMAQMELRNFGRDRIQTLSPRKTPPYANVDELQAEIHLLQEKLKKKGEEIEAERIRHKSTESMLIKERDLISADYDKISKRCEALELELAKRRRDDLQRRFLTNEHERTFLSEADRLERKDRIIRLQDELHDAREKISRLEIELALAKPVRAKTDDEMELMRKDIDELEIYKRNCQRRLSDQESTLRQLEEDVAVLMDEKAACEEKCSELKRVNERVLKENFDHLETINKLRAELSQAEQLQTESARAHISQIEAYQRLLKEKEAERAMFIEQLCREDRAQAAIVDSTPIIDGRFDSSLEKQRLQEAQKEIEGLNQAKQKLTEDVERLKSEQRSLEERLKGKERELEREIALRESTHSDLAKVREQLLKKDAELLDANSRAQALEVSVLKLESELTSSIERLELEKSSANSMKLAADELEEMLREKTTELVNATLEIQRLTSDAQRLKETIYDLDTKLTLQGRDLKETRSRLSDLRTKIKELEREAHDASLKRTPQTSPAAPSTAQTPSAS